MRQRILLCAIAAICFFYGHAQAQNVKLENCPGYDGAHPVVSDVTWSANCLLQAIYEKNKNVIAALSPEARCTTMAPCDGPLDEDTSRFIFGPVDPRYGLKSMFEMIAKAKSVTVAFNRDYGDIMNVLFIPRPGKKKDTPSGGWMSAFFACDFKLDDETGIWKVVTGFCSSESDVFSGGGEDEAAPLKEIMLDFESPSSDLPIVVWKAKK